MSTYTTVWQDGDQSLSLPRHYAVVDYPHELIANLTALIIETKVPGRFHLEASIADRFLRTGPKGIQFGGVTDNEYGYYVKVYYFPEAGTNRQTYTLEPPDPSDLVPGVVAIRSKLIALNEVFLLQKESDQK